MTEGQGQPPPVGEGLSALTAASPLLKAAEAFKLYLRNEGFSDYTIRAFRSDLRLLGNYLGHERPIGRISTRDLNDFLHYLLHERGIPCSPKSYARRITTLKAFFKWLHAGEVIPHDPAAALIHHSADAPLPEILSDAQVRRALAVTKELWKGKKKDPRPHLLLMLLLHTAIKKSECMSIRLEHIDRHSPDGPLVYIRYDNPAKKAKERKLPLPREILPVLDDYLERYKPRDLLFPCTARNLEYVLADVATRAGIKKRSKEGISFEMLRWTAAARDYRAGMDETLLRQKLGLSEITWQETRKKLEALTAVKE